MALAAGASGMGTRGAGDSLCAIYGTTTHLGNPDLWPETGPESQMPPAGGVPGAGKYQSCAVYGTRGLAATVIPKSLPADCHRRTVPA